MNVVITGASTGIGEACARWLDARGHRVFAGVRRDVDALQLREGASDRLTPVQLDVTDEPSIRAAAQQIDDATGGEGVHGIVNNAGVAVAGPLEFVALTDLRRQLDVNVVGQIAVTQAFLPSVKRLGGRVVFMGSIGGRVVTPFLGPYCASKFALEAIADSLRVELRPWRVHVAIVEPGSIATPIWTKSDSAASAAMTKAGALLERDYGAAMAALRAASAAAARRGRPPEAVAAVVEHALVSLHPRARYLIGVDARIQALLGTILPDRVRDRFLTRVLKLPDERR